MKNTRKIKAFTLIEILVVIWITIILFSAWSRLNFKGNSDRQQLNLLNNQIIYQFEKVRNNALLWKSISSIIGVPESWELVYTTASNWSINIKYLSGSLIPYPQYDIIASDFHSITNINCLDLNDIRVNTNIVSATIHIKWNDISITSGCSPGANKLQFTSQRKSFSNVFKINTLNWLISKD